MFMSVGIDAAGREKDDYHIWTVVLGMFFFYLNVSTVVFVIFALLLK